MSVEVYPTGERRPMTIHHDNALAYAAEAARAFGIGESKTVPFEPDRAKQDVKGETDSKAKSRRGKNKVGDDVHAS